MLIRLVALEFLVPKLFKIWTLVYLAWAIPTCGHKKSDSGDPPAHTIYTIEAMHGLWVLSESIAKVEPSNLIAPLLDARGKVFMLMENGSYAGQSFAPALDEQLTWSCAAAQTMHMVEQSLQLEANEACPAVIHTLIDVSPTRLVMETDLTHKSGRIERYQLSFDKVPTVAAVTTLATARGTHRGDVHPSFKRFFVSALSPADKPNEESAPITPETPPLEDGDDSTIEEPLDSLAKDPLSREFASWSITSDLDYYIGKGPGTGGYDSIWPVSTAITSLTDPGVGVQNGQFQADTQLKQNMAYCRFGLTGDYALKGAGRFLAEGQRFQVTAARLVYTDDGSTTDQDPGLVLTLVEAQSGQLPATATIRDLTCFHVLDQSLRLGANATTKQNILRIFQGMIHIDP